MTAIPPSLAAPRHRDRSRLACVAIMTLAVSAAAGEREPYRHPTPPIDPPPVLVDRSAIRLHPGLPPGATADHDAQSSLDVPILLVRLPPTGRAPVGALLIVPGGSYHHITVRPEDPLSDAMTARGVATFTLLYRFGRRHPWPCPGEDGLRALRLVKANAATWGFPGERVGLIAYSAGGHLASWCATGDTAGVARSDDVIARADAKPAFLALISPVTSMREDWAGTRTNTIPADTTPAAFAALSSDLRVTAATPPCFLWHAADDKLVAADANSGRFAAALRQAGVAMLYEHPPAGGHTPRTQPWLPAFLDWVRTGGWLGTLDR